VTDAWYYRWRGDVLPRVEVQTKLGPLDSPKDQPVEEWRGPFPSQGAALAQAEAILQEQLVRLREGRRKLHRKMEYVARRDRNG
jgi:hypothetical protein